MRAVRRWVTAEISAGAVGCAPWLGKDTVDVVEAVVGRLGRRFPIVSRLVAENMRSAGLYTPERHREYFRQVSAHLAGWMHIFRYARAAGDGTGGMPAGLRRIAEERIQLDDSFAVVEEVARRGMGAVVVGMHLTNFPLLLARMNGHVPTAVLARYSKDPRRQRNKERWWAATGIGSVALPSRAAEPGARLAKMAAVLRQGHVMVVAGDMARKRDEGTPVRMFDRQVHLPTGPAVLSVKTGAPLMLFTGSPVGRAVRATFHGPFEGTVKPGPDGWQRDAVLERLQWLATGVEAFVREHPPLWFSWGDKHWTRVFHGDPRYVDASGEAERADAPTTNADPGGA